jgi:EamA domain-containing membrane protein RarD
MLVTLMGMVMLVKPLKLNAAFPMQVTLLGMFEFLHPDIKVLLAVSMIALQLSRESNIVFPELTVILIRLEQSENAPTPMLVTL